MGFFDFFRRKKYYDYEDYIEESCEEEKEEIINVDGYEIDAKTGLVISVPKGLEIYNLPLECKGFSDKANETMLASVVEIHFHPDSKITEIIPHRGLFDGLSVCGKLKKVTLPNTLKNLSGIPGYLFNNYGVIYNFPDDMETLYLGMIPQNVEKLDLSNVSQLIGGHSLILGHNYGVKFLKMPKKLGTEKVPPISNAQALETLVIPEGFTFMDFDCLFGCNNLIDVYIPHSLSKFCLYKDDYRPLEKHDGSYYQVDIEKCQNRKIRLHKTIGDEIVVFEVSRKNFSALLVDDKEVKFISSGIGELVIPLENIMMNSYYIVDVENKKIQRCSVQDNQCVYEEDGYVSKRRR